VTAKRLNLLGQNKMPEPYYGEANQRL